MSIEAQGLLLTGQSYAFQCTADVVAELLPSLGLELLAPNRTSLASLTSHGSSTVQYTLSSLEKSDRGEYMCRAILAIPGSGIDSSTTDSTFITVEGMCINKLTVTFSLLDVLMGMFVSKIL